jgi:hypothetical protein
MLQIMTNEAIIENSANSSPPKPKGERSSPPRLHRQNATDDATEWAVSPHGLSAMRQHNPPGMAHLEAEIDLENIFSDGGAWGGISPGVDHGDFEVPTPPGSPQPSTRPCSPASAQGREESEQQHGTRGMTTDEWYHSQAICAQKLEQYNSVYLMASNNGQVVVVDTSRCTRIGQSGDIVEWRPQGFTTERACDLVIVNKPPSGRRPMEDRWCKGQSRPPTDSSTDSTHEIEYAKIWLRSKYAKRAENGFTFDPELAPLSLVEGSFNLFRGLAVEPAQLGPVNLIEKHIFEVLANGRSLTYNWIIDCMSQMVQQPNKRLMVVPCFLGSPGCGKGIILEKLIGGWFGKHFQHLSGIEGLTTKYNAFMADTLHIFVDEVSATESKKTNSVLKYLITEPTLRAEEKFQAAKKVPNRTNIFMASNECHVLNVDANDRRLVPTQCSPKYCFNQPYFNQLHDQIDHGGSEAFLHYCMHRELDPLFQAHKPPSEMWMSKWVQILQSLPPMTSWWHHKLVHSTDEGWAPDFYLDEALQEYRAYCVKSQLSKAVDGTTIFAFAQAFLKVLPDKATDPRRSTRQSKRRVKSRMAEPGTKAAAVTRTAVYTAPPLRACKEFFASTVILAPDGLDIFDKQFLGLEN